MPESLVQSAMNLRPVRSRIGFNVDELYDVNLAILTHCEGGDLRRIECMKRAGVLNVEGLRVHVSIITSPGDFDYANEIGTGWMDTMDVSILEMRLRYPVPKINGYYLWLRESGLQARWHGRVDDDSMTDLSVAISYLDERFNESPVHVASSPVFQQEHTPCFVPYLLELGISLTHSRHEYESSFTSKKGMEVIFSNETACRMLISTGNHFRDTPHGVSGDRALAFAAEIAGVPVADNPKSRCEFLPDRFSKFSGNLHHIHYVPWHKDETRLILFGLTQPFSEGVSDEIVSNFVDRPICCYLGPQNVQVVTMLSDGLIVGGEQQEFHRWEKQTSCLRFLSRTSAVVACFEKAGSVEGEWMMRGFGISNDKPHLLRLPTFSNISDSSYLRRSSNAQASLCDFEHIYYRVGHDHRLMTFSLDGRILLGTASKELHWRIESGADGDTLSIIGDQEITCILHSYADGIWRGRWLHFEKMPVVIFPISGGNAHTP